MSRMKTINQEEKGKIGKVEYVRKERMEFSTYAIAVSGLLSAVISNPLGNKRHISISLKKENEERRRINKFRKDQLKKEKL